MFLHINELRMVKKCQARLLGVPNSFADFQCSQSEFGSSSFNISLVVFLCHSTCSWFSTLTKVKPSVCLIQGAADSNQLTSVLSLSVLMLAVQFHPDFRTMRATFYQEVDQYVLIHPSLKI